jgi:hypothetical protein
MKQISGVTLQMLRRGRFAALIALAGVGLLFTASNAKAGCAVPSTLTAAAPAIPFLSPHADRSDRHDDDRDDRATIVGLWHVIYTANYANGLPSPPFPATTPFQFLESYKTWHEDGTEFENAFLPPAAGNICFGVWKEQGARRVKLHHIGLMFAPDGSIANVFTVDEVDIVAPHGKTYTGVFDFKLFPPKDVYGTGTPLAEAKGTTAGTRITVD